MIPFLLACSLFSALTGAISLLRLSRKAAPLHSLEAYDSYIDDLDFTDPDTLTYYRDYLEDHYLNPAAQRRCP